MNYEDFIKFVQSKCMHETIYEDSEGRLILVIEMLDAYSLINRVNVEPCCGDFENCDKVCMPRAKHAEREACADIAENWNSNGMPRTGVANAIRARGQA
jgi:hypothetical protein